jgi:hypothetical protein
MHVEADFLGVCGPVFIAEAVFELAVLRCDERVVARADRAFVNLECVGWVLDLWTSQASQRMFLLKC